MKCSQTEMVYFLGGREIRYSDIFWYTVALVTEALVKQLFSHKVML